MFYAFIHAFHYLAYPGALAHRVQSILISAFKPYEDLVYACSSCKRQNIIPDPGELIHPAVDAGQTDIQVFLEQKIKHLLNAPHIKEKIAVPYHEGVYIIGLCKIFKL